MYKTLLMPISPFPTIVLNPYNLSPFYKYTPIRFNFTIQNTSIIPSTHYKCKIINKYNSFENTKVVVKHNTLIATYEELALLLFALKNIGTTDHFQPLIYTVLENRQKVLSTDINLFLNEITKTDNLFIDLKVGKKKTLFRFIIERNKKEITVQTKIYHPESLSSTNVLKLLSNQINQEMKLLSLSLYHYNRHLRPLRCLNRLHTF